MTQRKSKKWRGPKAVGAYVPNVAKAAFEAHGFPSSAVLSDWPLIAGDDMAAFTAPERLVWPRRPEDAPPDNGARKPAGKRRPTGATLVLRVDGPRAIEVQHGAPHIIERINSYFGYRAVASVRIVQGPVAKRGMRPSAQESDPPPDDEGLERIKDEGLRAALARLNARVD